MKKGLRLLGMTSLLVIGGASLNSCNAGYGDIALICLHDENSTYDKNFIDAFKKACEEGGVKYSITTGVPETHDCETKAKEIAASGTKYIISDSYGHQTHMLEAAKEFKDTQFISCTGDIAKCEKWYDYATESEKEGGKNYANYHNAFASIYEGRYLAGVAAGYKLKELREAGKLKGDVPTIGYVGAYPYNEVVSGYTSFYLGAKQVCDDVVMNVTFTNSWYDFDKEKENANTLITKYNCDLISQHADSYGAPEACNDNNIPNVCYNLSTNDKYPNSYIAASKINWTPYFKTVVDCYKNNKELVKDYCGTLNNGSVEVMTDSDWLKDKTDIKNEIDKHLNALKAGTIKVFDTDTFTINHGQKLTSSIATVDGKKIELIKDYTDEGGNPSKYFAESDVNLYRSAPYFPTDSSDFHFDGITILSNN